MQLILTIDDATQATRILNGFCNGSSYDPGSGITKADWVRQKLSDYMKLTAKRGEFKVSQGTIISEIDSIVVH